MSDDIEPVESGPEVESQEAGSVEAPLQHSEPSPWDSFKSLPEFQGQDDRAIAASLYQAMQRERAASQELARYQQVMPVAQEYLTHRESYQKWLESQRAPQQQQPQQQQVEAAKKWWNPPEVKESHRRYLVKDEQGRDTISPDAPFDARASLSDWLAYRADFAQRFLTNPEEALGPMVAELAQKQAMELVEKTMETRDNESYVSDFLTQNADWLQDPNTGSVTPAGLLFHNMVEQAKSQGITSPRARVEFAVAMTERAMLAQKYDLDRSMAQRAPQQQAYQPSPPQPPQVQEQQGQAERNMNYLRREASRSPSRAGGAANQEDPRQPRQKQTFEQMLAAAAAEKSLI
jgi:hypothetical protein